MITREFKLYLNAGVGVAPVINANQFDQDEEWIFTLLQSDGTVYTPSTGAIIGLKQDGTTILNAGTVNSSGQVVITETEQMTAVPGANLFEILIDGNTHGTANFVVFVERRPGDIDNPSESDISLFQEAITAAGNVTQFQADISALQTGLSQETQTRQTQDASLASQIAQETSARTQQDAVLQAEIDQIIAPSGEAPSAAEVENARIGVDGTTYDTLGNAIRTQVSDLKNAIIALSNINNVPFEWGTVYNGSINTEQTRIHTVNLLWTPKGTILKTSANYTSLAVPVYNLDGTYKANGTWVSQWTAEEDCYIRPMLRKQSGNIAESEFASLINAVTVYYPLQVVSDVAYSAYKSASELKVVQNAYGILDTSKSDNISLPNLFDKNSSGNTLDGYYDRTNTFVSSTTLGMTDYIMVVQGLEYYTNQSGSFYVLWYDSQKTFLTYTNVSSSSVKFSPVAKANYMRIVFSINTINSYTVKCDSIFAVKATESPYSGKNGVAFGTSLTYRAQSTGGYLQYLPSLCDANIENKGLGNSTIYDNGSNPNMMNVITGYNDYASKDFALLEGFVNDWYYNSNVVGTWKDTGTTTVCGCVRTAIQHILTQNPSITLILIIDPIGRSASGVDCSSLAERNGLTQTEFYDEIAKVADSLGIPTIRVDRLSGMSELTPYMYIDNIHPNAKGAEQTANIIWSVMKNIPVKVINE